MDLLAEIKKTRDLLQQLQGISASLGDGGKASGYHIAWNELEDIIQQYESENNE
jgi:hypothetical protein